MVIISFFAHPSDTCDEANILSVPSHNENIIEEVGERRFTRRADVVFEAVEVSRGARLLHRLPHTWPDAILPLFNDCVCCTLNVSYHCIRKRSGYITADLHCGLPNCNGKFRLESILGRRKWRLKILREPQNHRRIPRPLCRERRQLVLADLRNTHPAQVRADMAAVEASVGRSTDDFGMSSEVPTMHVLRQAMYEQRHAGRQDVNPILDVLKRAEILVPPFVQNVSASEPTAPTVISMWLETAVDLMRLLYQNGLEVILGMDSTKCPVTTTVSHGKCFYYYGVVLRHPLSGESPISVMDMVSFFL